MAVLPGHQVHGDLGVGVAGELDAGGLELGAQRGEVLDDAVVDDGDLAGGVAVRVGVAVGRAGRGWPSGCGPCRWCRSSSPASASSSAASRLASRPARLADGQSAGAVEQRDARRVVAAVLHPAQRVDDDVAGRTLPDVADDSAHELKGSAGAASECRQPCGVTARGGELRSSGGQDEEALRCVDPTGPAPRSAR